MRDLEISKELLNEVLEEDVLSVRPYIPDDPFYKNVIMWEYRKNTYDTINIYELAHKCKEWAMSKGCQIISGLSDEPAYRRQDEKAYAQIRYYFEDEFGNGDYEDKYFMANTEVEAVIKASEYVLKEINEKTN